ncbi:AraC family transcriptional regulator [Portibacter lacus]|uniref:Transcriptional regulator n=1 Tax=Portibacter lacus TaxID=1099794 RepID=A0AA37STF1_9BACT|nr:AraC family transcriptional regulator [Portibacter lacus]GLR17853.1 transcriptional regulator [Portibacter lacus]
MDSDAIQDGFLGQRVVIIPKQTRKELKSNVLTAPFYITDIGRYPKAIHHLKERRKGCNQYIFIYCTSGRGWVKIKGERITISPNEFIIIEKNTPHQYGASEKDPWTILWMHYTGHLSDALFERYNEMNQTVHEVPFLNERIKVFDQIFEVLAENYRAKDLEYACLLSLNFMSSFIFNKVDKHSHNFKKNNLVQDIINFLNQNMDKTLKSDDLAHKFHYSVSHILSTFKKNTGYPLFQFFNMKKIQKACEYLNYTDLSIKEISFKLGYQDPLYFSRVFKGQMGVSPRQYRAEQFD